MKTRSVKVFLRCGRMGNKADSNGINVRSHKWWLGASRCRVALLDALVRESWPLCRPDEVARANTIVEQRLGLLSDRPLLDVAGVFGEAPVALLP